MAANESSVRTVPPSSTCSDPDALGGSAAAAASADASPVNASDPGLPSDTHSQIERGEGGEAARQGEGGRGRERDFCLSSEQLSAT